MTTYEEELFQLKQKHNHELTQLRNKFKKKETTTNSTKRISNPHAHEWKILYREPVSGLCHEECVLCKEFRSI